MLRHDTNVLTSPCIIEAARTMLLSQSQPIGFGMHALGCRDIQSKFQGFTILPAHETADPMLKTFGMRGHFVQQ